uniref:Head-to-tail stopper n=10 Tax=unclassified Caudoviricetes TaxID=2788787 RepID=A0AB39U295_9CAUD
MSLLRRGTETVTVYPEVTVTDSDGNKFTRPGSVGIVVKASVQPLGLLGAPAENTDGGFNTQSRYRLRLAGGWPTGGGILGAQARVEWRGKRYSIEGDAQLHTGSPRTAHAVYTMVRS